MLYRSISYDEIQQYLNVENEKNSLKESASFNLSPEKIKKLVPTFLSLSKFLGQFSRQGHLNSQMPELRILKKPAESSDGMKKMGTILEAALATTMSAKWTLSERRHFVSTVLRNWAEFLRVEHNQIVEQIKAEDLSKIKDKVSH